MLEEDEIPPPLHFFRKYKAMPEIGRKALDMAAGRTLDAGAGFVCHSLVLQEKGIDMTAIISSPLPPVSAYPKPRIFRKCCRSSTVIGTRRSVDLSEKE